MSSLLDLMVQDEVQEKEEKVERRIAENRVATDLERERREARQKAAEAEWRALEQKAVDQAAQRPPEIAGLREGMRFNMQRCGEGIDGDWIVHRVDPGPAGDQSRVLYGRRADGAPGYLPLTERKALDAIHHGILTRRD